MTDIVERLESFCLEVGARRCQCSRCQTTRDAIDEIQRLREELEELKDAATHNAVIQKVFSNTAETIERLREALQQIANMDTSGRLSASNFARQALGQDTPDAC